VTSSKDSFQNFEARIGYGTGNVADGGSYNIDYLSRNRFRLEAMYRSSWICGKAVDSVAEDMTKRGIEINSEIDPGESDELMRVWKQLKLWDAIADTIKWSRLYGGAVAVLLIDGQNLSTPLRIETVKKDQFKGLLALDRRQLQPSLQNLISEMGPELGLPMFYETLGGARLLPQTKIHYSRVIRLDGQDLPYWQRIAEKLWGQPVLEGFSTACSRSIRRRRARRTGKSWRACISSSQTLPRICGRTATSRSSSSERNCSRSIAIPSCKRCLRGRRKATVPLPTARA
jgi:phage-related protein (TIGR01555 family)